MKTLGLELGLVWNQALWIAPQSGCHQLCNLFENNDTTTRTFLSPIIQQQPVPLADKLNPDGLVSIYFECTLFWICSLQNTDCTQGVHGPCTSRVVLIFLLFIVQQFADTEIHVWSLTICFFWCLWCVQVCLHVRKRWWVSFHTHKRAQGNPSQPVPILSNSFTKYHLYLSWEYME